MLFGRFVVVAAAGKARRFSRGGEFRGYGGLVVSVVRMVGGAPRCRAETKTTGG